MAHASAKAGPFGDSFLAEQLCHTRAMPLLRQALGNDGLRSGAWRDGVLERQTCAAGLVAALTLCAVVHAGQLAGVAKRRGEDGANSDVAANAGSRVESFDWGSAVSYWPWRVPADCEERAWCRPYLEALVGMEALRYCQHCVKDSAWPIDADDVTDNGGRWLQRLFNVLSIPEGSVSSKDDVRRLPPPWRGKSPQEIVRRQHPLAGAGIFAGADRGSLPDASGVSWLVHHLAVSWYQEALTTVSDTFFSSETATTGLQRNVAGVKGGESRGRQLFKQIFGPLSHPWEIGSRGPSGVRVESHRADFVGAQRGSLRFFIYDLPDVVHTRILATLHGRVRESVHEPSTCDFGLSRCSELHGGGGAFSGYRPYAAEATFLAKLLRAPEGILVEDPGEATFFVVPFFSSSWCFLGAAKCWVRCGGLRPLNALLPLLVHYNASTAHRHLFLGSDSTGDLTVDLQMQPLMLSYGPNPCNIGSGPIIIPPPVTDDLPLLRLGDFASKDLFLFTADGVGGRPFRLEALVELERWQRRLPHLFVIGRRDAHGSPKKGGVPSSPPSASTWALALRRAVFCPVFPGDNTFRMRLFHVVIAGCIPVVIKFPGQSWYRRHGPSVERSFPFASRIDWHGLAVELPHDPQSEAFSDWARRLVPTLLRLSPEELRARQSRLAAAAPLLQYDFEGRRPDAFTAILDELAARVTVPPEALECFDPRQRFGTSRCVSGSPSVEREEREVFGVVACCPALARRQEAEAASADQLNAGSASALRRLIQKVPLRADSDSRASTATSHAPQVPTRLQRQSCDILSRGRCIRYVGLALSKGNNMSEEEASTLPTRIPSKEAAEQEAHIRAHLRSVFSGRRYEKRLPEDDLCAG
eukprot:TRINITY_DN26832_c0_g4_i1.p1 TRINITY_DN26832_c0_g4~~TRINITY_DN26832_c0_g4_i1.p1  ORF type:complete len:949 (+),score=92.72 TRINITY_DN26832_c0_g4_i1:242-2848(+)